MIGLAGLRKYLSLYGMIFRTSFIADLEYRVNFVTRIVTDIFWYAAQVIAFEVLYRHTDLIGDWTLPQTRVFLGMIFVVDAIYMVLLHDNLDRFSDKVRKGELDLLLAKPINSQFMVSLNRASTALLGNFTIAVSWLSWSLWQLPDFNWARVLWLLVLIPSGVVVLYSCRFFMSATAVIFTRAENLQFVWYQIYKLGMRPDSIYVPWFKFIILTVIPVGVIASVPARALLNPPDLLLFAWAILLAPLLVWLSSRYWRFCLRHYSSASS